jgi:hypothetical protein
MTGADEFGYNGGSDPTGRARDKNSHEDLLKPLIHSDATASYQ